MKNVRLFLASAAVACLSLTSCSSDDGGSSTGIDENASIEGKWKYHKEGGIVNGSEQLFNYEHTAGCEKDFTELFSDGTAEEIWYEGTSCEEFSTTGQWSRVGNTININLSGFEHEAEIVTLTNSTLKVHYTEPGDDVTYVTVYKR